MTFDKYVDYGDLKIRLTMGKMVLNFLTISFNPMTPGKCAAMHAHSTYELHFIAQGLGTLKTPEQTYDLKPGTFYLTGPGVLHEQYSDYQHPMLEFGFNFDIELSKEKTTKGRVVIDDEIDEIFQTLLETKFWFGEDKFDSRSHFEKIYEEMQNQLVGYYQNIQNYLSLIVMNTLRYYNNEKRADYALPRKTIDDNKNRIMDGFFRNFREKQTLSVLARALSVSPRQAERIVLDIYGESFSERLMNSRLTNAKRLLIDEDFSVEKVALRSGFASLAYFSRSFKARVGLSPRQFRDKYKPVEPVPLPEIIG